MTQLEISNMILVDAEDTDEKLTAVFEEIQREMGVPFVPNLFRATASSHTALLGSWELMKQVYLRSTLPRAITAMILYYVADKNNCAYCASVHSVTCQTLGITQETLSVLSSDVTKLNPERVQVILSFASKCAFDPHNLVEEDYEKLRDQGVTDEEITEIITVTALGKYLDTIADAMKIEVDEPIAEALKG